MLVALVRVRTTEDSPCLLPVLLSTSRAFLSVDAMTTMESSHKLAAFLIMQTLISNIEDMLRN